MSTTVSALTHSMLYSFMFAWSIFIWLGVFCMLEFQEFRSSLPRFCSTWCFYDFSWFAQVSPFRPWLRHFRSSLCKTRQRYEMSMRASLEPLIFPKRKSRATRWKVRVRKRNVNADYRAQKQCVSALLVSVSRCRSQGTKVWTRACAALFVLLTSLCL